MSSAVDYAPIIINRGVTNRADLTRVRETPYLVYGVGRWLSTIESPDIVTGKLTEVQAVCLRGGSVTLTSAQYARFVGVRFENCAVVLDGCWDCEFHDCDFVRYDSSRIPLDLYSRLRQTNCITINGCRFEDPSDTVLDSRQNKYCHISLANGCRKIDIAGNKFHGPFTTRHVAAVGVASLRVMDNNFTHGSSANRRLNTGLFLDSCNDVLVSRNVIDNFANGIVVSNCRGVSLDSNLYPQDQPNGTNVRYQ